MADFLSQFVGKVETPSVEFKHHRGNRKVSDSATSNEELDSLYDQILEASSDDDIKRVISEVNPNLVLSNRETHYWGEVLTFTVEGFDDFVYADVPMYKTETLKRLAELISPKNLHPRSPRRVTVNDAEGDRFYTERAYLADKEDIERIISESNPILEYAGGGSGIMGRTITFTIKGRDDLNHIDVPITKATTLAELAELISPDNLPHPTEFVEDSTKKVKDAEGDDDDDDFEGEPKREFTDEEIIDFARNHDGFGYELYVEAYRDKGYDDDLWETMDRLDDVIVNQPASWLLDRMFYGDFNPRHAYWRFNGYGNLESFDASFESLFDKHIDETVIVEYIRDNMDKYREYLEEYFEDDED